MSKLTSVIAITALGSVGFASSAFAGETMEPKMDTASVETAVMTEAPDAKVTMIRAEAEAEVMGAVERGEFTAVEGPDGRIYYNHIVPVSELPDPELDIEVLDTFQVEYEGDVYTNKLVQDRG